jgi:integrase
MATIRQRGNGSWEVVIRRKGVLDKAHYATAETEEDARTYARRLEGELDQGIMPIEISTPTIHAAETIYDWARLYLQQVVISNADHEYLNFLLERMKSWPVTHITMEWAEKWIAEMKKVERLSPTTIKHKVGAVARLLDWCLRKKWIAVNPLRMLPKRYASYSKEDGEKRVDVERERRLFPGEYERVIELLDGGVPLSGRNIDYENRDAWRLLFILAVETAMRLSEMFTLSVSQINLDKKTIFLDKTKNGDKRQVPLSSIALAELTLWLKDKEANDLVFPWWSGDYDKAVIKRVSSQLSGKWRTIAKKTGCEGLRFHDLRHEATSRLYERTRLSDLQISKITGHKDLRMLKRYANLRGSDLAEMLW